MAEAVTLPRRQALVLVVLTCIPVPVLTIGGFAFPLPELAQRALAPLLPFVDAPDNSRVSWREAGSVHAVSILSTPSERRGIDALGPSSKLDASVAPAARTQAARGFSSLENASTPEPAAGHVDGDEPVAAVSTPAGGEGAGTNTGADESPGRPGPSRGRGRTVKWLRRRREQRNWRQRLWQRQQLWRQCWLRQRKRR